MAKTAKFQVYNGLTWEELKFPPSDHTHDNYCTEEEVLALIQNAGGGGNVDLSGYLPITGGEITGDIIVDGEIKTQGFLFASTVSADEICLGENDEVYIDDGGITTPGLFISNGYIYISTLQGTNHAIGWGNASGSTSGIGYGDYGELVLFNDNDANVINIGYRDGTYTAWNLPSSGYDIASTADIPTYYMHTVNLKGSGNGSYDISFTVLRKSNTSLTAATMYNTYGSKAFAASGYFGSTGAVVNRIAFTSTTTVRIVYGTSGATSNSAIVSFTDTVIPVS